MTEGATSQDNPDSRLPRNVWVTTLTSFFTDISSEMILNLLPLFLANVLGTPTALIGLIEGVAETTSSLLKVVSGWLSDRLATRKWLAVVGYGLSSLSKPFLYFAVNWAGVLAIRFADRAGKGIRTAPRDALIADSIQPHRRGLAFGLHRAGDTLGAFIGLSIALIVVLATQSQAVELSRITFQNLVLLSIVPAFLAVVILAFGARDVPIKAKSSISTTPSSLRLTFAALPTDFKVFLLVIAVFTLGNSSDSFLILRAQERGLSVVGVMGMLMTFNLIYAVLSSPLGALSDRVGRKRLLIGGWIVYGIIYLGFATVQESWQVWAVYGLYGVYYAAVEGTAKAYVADLISSEQRGTAYGVYNAVIGLMALPASLLAGVVWQVFGASAPFLMGAVLALMAVALLIIYTPSSKTAPSSISIA